MYAYLFWINNIHQRFADGYFADGAHVKAVDVIPPVNFLVFVLAVLYATYEESGSVREQHSVWLQPLVPRVQHCVQHRLVEQTVPETHITHWQMH